MFEPRRRDAVKCSAACRQRAYRRRASTRSPGRDSFAIKRTFTAALETPNLSYEHALLDWAISELNSPRWTKNYAGFNAALRENVRDPALDIWSGLTPDERRALVTAVEIVRRPLLSHYKITPHWRFKKITISGDDLRGLAIAYCFSAQSLGEQLELWRAQKTPEDASMWTGAISPMLETVHQGGKLRGTSIAILSPGEGRLRLIEGYGRCSVALLTGVQSLPMYAGEP
jgi:hypothetical protein